MFKRVLAIATLLCALPMLANAATQGPSDQRVSAPFARVKYTLTATAGAGGTVFPASTIAFAGKQVPVKTFIFRPLFGTGVEAITGTYLTNTIFQYRNALTGAAIPSLPAPPGVRVRVVITNVTDNATLAGVFATQQTDAGPNQTVLTGALVTLNGSLSTGFGPYAWTQVSGPTTVTLSGANSNTATFTALTVGTYVFKLTHGTTSATTAVFVTDSLALAIKAQCVDCHASVGVGSGFSPGGVYANWSSSVHKNNFVVCYDCHVGANTGGHPGVEQCTTCHGDFGIVPTDYNASCAACHSGVNVHGAQLVTRSSCIDCHAVAIQHPGYFVNDNNGVRAITGTAGEFALSARVTANGARSHHIVNANGADPDNAQCIMCHLEGKVGPNRTVVIDRNYHMTDAKVHLRSGNLTISPNVAWDPMSPDHTAMDNFCMSCHNAAGAVDSFANVSGALKAAANVIANGVIPSPRNPFGDKLTNEYDQMPRDFVVAVHEQFDPGNTSHHAVRGQKYTGKTRAEVASRNLVPNAADVFTRYSGAVVGNVHPRAGATVNTVWQYFGSYSTAYGNSGYGPKSPGTRKTIYEAQLFASAFRTLSGLQLSDDVTLHCGDCHTVGQWKPNSATTAAGGATTDVIGAHGSINEYLLRNSLGTDALHHQSTTPAPASISYDANGYAIGLITNGSLVCFLCHRQDAYQGNQNFFNWADPLTGVKSGTRHGGLGGDDCDSDKRDSSGQIGSVNRVGAVVSVPTGNMSTILGLVCTNCHSSGNKIFGGIHGNGSSYGITNVGYLTYSTNGKDAQTNVLAGAAGVLGGTGTTENRNMQLSVVTRKPYRFMGGVSLKYSGGGSADKWEAKTLTTQHREGCYNLSTNATGVKQWSAGNGGVLDVASDFVSGTTNALPGITNGNDDIGFATSGTAAQNINNGAAGSWGSCGHHVGDISSGTTNMPKRTIQRPLIY